MECDRYFPSVPFVVLIVDQFDGQGGSAIERQKQNNYVNRRTSTLHLIFWKNT